MSGVRSGQLKVYAAELKLLYPGLMHVCIPLNLILLACSIISQPATEGANANEEASLITWPGPASPNMTYVHKRSLSVRICPSVHHIRWVVPQDMEGQYVTIV